MDIGHIMKAHVVQHTLDLSLQQLYNSSAFSYQDYEEACARVTVLLANLQLVLMLEEETNENKLRDACVRWVKTTEDSMPLGWGQDRLDFIRSTPAWEMVLKAIAGEVPFKTLIGITQDVSAQAADVK